MTNENIPHAAQTANATQVGGTHYKTAFEHWDLAHEANLGYFEGQISKYITRHRSKAGEVDVKKALHLCDKLVELVLYKGRKPQHAPLGLSMLRMTQYAEANELQPLEYACVNSICGWCEVEDLFALRDHIKRILRECYPEDDGTAGPGYVNQG